MNNVVIRGIWGDGRMIKLGRRARDAQLPPYQMMLQEMEQLADRLVNHDAEQLDTFYVNGIQNYEHARKLGLPAFQLSTEPYESPRLFKRFVIPGPWYRVWGYSTWWHKLKMIDYAFKMGADAVLWLDLRVKIVKRLDEDFWGRHCQPFHGALCKQPSTAYGAWWRYVNPNRAPLYQIRQLPGDPSEQHWVPGGGALLFRGRSGWELVRLALSIMDDNPTFSDMQAIAAAIDFRHGEWIGLGMWSKRYALRGYYYAGNLDWYRPESRYLVIGEPLHRGRHYQRLRIPLRGSKV